MTNALLCMISRFTDSAARMGGEYQPLRARYCALSVNLMGQTETEDILLGKGVADTISRPLETVEKLIRPGRIPSPGNPCPISSPAVESVIYIGVHLPEPFRVREGVPGIVSG